MGVQTARPVSQGKEDVRDAKAPWSVVREGRRKKVATQGGEERSTKEVDKGGRVGSRGDVRKSGKASEGGWKDGKQDCKKGETNQTRNATERWSRRQNGTD